MMKIQMPTNLRSRMALFNAVFLTGILLASLALVYFVLMTWLYHQTDSSLAVMAKQAALNITVENNNIVYKQGATNSELEKQRQFMRITDIMGGVQEHFGPLKDLPVDISGVASYSKNGKFQDITKPGDDEVIRVYTLPAIYRGKIIGFVQTGQSLETIQNMLQLVILTLLMLAPLTFIITLLSSRWITSKALTPLAGIADTAERITEQELHRRLGIQGEDEVARLAASLDRMLNRLEEAFEGYKQFTGDASHELRTPLTVMKGEISLALQKERDSSYYREVIKGIDEEVDRLIRMVEQLLFLARADQEQLQLENKRFNLLEASTPLLEQMVCLAQAKQQQLTWHIPNNEFVVSDQDVVQQILLNLLDNAIKYTPDGGEITVTVIRIENKSKILVSDTGNGIAEEHVDRIFDRFYRVDKGRSRAMGGTGLGLAIAKKLATIIGGHLKVESIFGKGTTFILEMPGQNY